MVLKTTAHLDAPRVVIIEGPTGIGKSDFALQLAIQLGCPIISADSRQIFREIPIGTAAPDSTELGKVPYYQVGTRSILEDYSVSAYETETMNILQGLFDAYPMVIVCGGSMLYIEALERGIDPLPPIDLEVRHRLKQQLQEEGLAALNTLLYRVDREYYNEVDLKNSRRVLHALEIYFSCGTPYSRFRRGRGAERPFSLRKILLEMPREELYNRINRRTWQMIEKGWLQEALHLYPYRTRNALDTIGYKEIYTFFESAIILMKKTGILPAEKNEAQELCTLEAVAEAAKKGVLAKQFPLLEPLFDQAVTDIQTNTRAYARKQVIRFRKDPSTMHLSPDTPPERVIPLLGIR